MANGPLFSLCPWGPLPLLPAHQWCVEGRGAATSWRCWSPLIQQTLSLQLLPVVGRAILPLHCTPIRQHVNMSHLAPCGAHGALQVSPQVPEAKR